jgi:Ca2+-binding RTX toxin-like protein
MGTFNGTANNDTFNGTATADVFNLGQGGNDTANGLGGDDVFNFGAALTSADRIDGGAGNDTVILAGDYSAGLVFGEDVMANVETLNLGAGFNYNLTTNDQGIGVARLTVDASALGATNRLVFDGSAEIDGFFSVTGGAGNDTITGGNAAGSSCDFFYLQAGGKDTVSGLGGSDNFLMGGAFTAADTINGGADSDFVILDGDYSAGVTFSATTMRNVEYIATNPGHDYKLTTADATVATGATLAVNFPTEGPGIAGQLGTGDTLYFDGSAETDGSFVLTGGPSGDTLIGGALGDAFYSGGGGADAIQGGGGDDEFFFGGDLNGNDTVNGGGGHDIMFIDGDYSAGLTLSGAHITKIEVFLLEGNTDYTITTTDSFVDAGQQKAIEMDPSSLGVFRFDGSAETNGEFQLVGGAKNDHITGGAKQDLIRGSGGADQIKGGGGTDYYFYDTVDDSTSKHYDTIHGFDANQDTLVFFQGVPNALDAKVTHGALSSTSFDADLAAAIDASHLHANDAVLFEPNAGTLSGETFLVVDDNGHAGYQAGEDFVIHLADPLHMSNFSLYNNFTD